MLKFFEAVYNVNESTLISNNSPKIILLRTEKIYTFDLNLKSLTNLNCCLAVLWVKFQVFC